jgi:hypothetical protein
MTRPASHAAVSSFDHRADIALSRLWFGILAAPTAWVAQGGLGWFFGNRICTTMSIESVRLVIGAISVLAIAAAAWGLSTAWHNWQRAGDQRSFEAWDRVAFMSMAGVLVSASFLIGTVWAGLTPLMLGACGGMR